MPKQVQVRGTAQPNVREVPARSREGRYDPFGEPAIAEEMRQLLGIRYVCATLGCDWWGYTLIPEELCPRCGHMPVDRWKEHARAISGSHA